MDPIFDTCRDSTYKLNINEILYILNSFTMYEVVSSADKMYTPNYICWMYSIKSKYNIETSQPWTYSQYTNYFEPLYINFEVDCCRVSVRLQYVGSDSEPISTPMSCAVDTGMATKSENPGNRGFEACKICLPVLLKKSCFLSFYTSYTQKFYNIIEQKYLCYSKILHLTYIFIMP